MLTSKHRLSVLAVALVALSCICVVYGRQAREKSVSVLFIGNSYTYVNNMPSILEQLSASAKDTKPIRCAAAVAGGTTLEMHWNDPKAREALTSRKWDYVVLQEQSTRPITDPELFRTYGGLLAGEAKRLGAKPLFYMTWAREEAPEKQETITQAYRSVASDSGAIVVPVGEAWRTVRRQGSGSGLFAEDGSHPSVAGSYLAACTFYAAITGKTPIGLTNKITVGNSTLKLSLDDAAYLQKAARDAVDREKR